MQFPRFAMGPLLAGCALVALGSCTTEDQESEPGLGPNMSPSVSAVSAYNLVKVPAMTIDGNLAEWANITAISMADQSGRTGGLDNTAKVKLAWDDTYLYAAYDVTDSELLALQTTRDHADIYKDDEVELYIDPQGDGASATSMTATDYQFLANVGAAVGDKRGNGTGGKDDTFNAPSFLAKAVAIGTLNASGTDTGYKLELRIAWADLGVTPAPGHFMRLDPAVGDRDASGPPPSYEFDWAGATPVYNNPSAWNDVQLVNRPPPVSAYDIVKVAAAPTIDGSLVDWAGVPAISIADNSGRSGGVANTAKVKFVWDPTYLYFAYDVTDTELLALQTARDHAQIYLDDEVELYIDPQGDGWATPMMTPTDYQFLANVRDAVGDKNGTNPPGGKDAAFNAPSFLAKAGINGTLNASGTDVGYTVEARISWSDLGVTPAAGNFMRIDPAVGDKDASGTFSFDWTGLTTGWNNPLAWKDVKLAVDNTAPAAPTNLVLAVISSSQIDVSWTASSGTDVAKYNIYRATTGTPSLYKTVSGSPYHDTGLTQGTSYTYQIAAVDAAGNESSKTPAKVATPGGSSGSGIPFGPYSLWSDSYSAPNEAPGVFTMSTNSDGPSGVVTRINAARSLGHKLILMLTSGKHNLYLSDPTRPTYQCPESGGSGCQFDMEKWKDRVDLFNTTAIKDTIAHAVADGTVLGYNMLDEPQHSSWGGVITKAVMDSMAAYSKGIFPTLPAGMSVKFSYRPDERWRVLDFVVTQYIEDFKDVTKWRDSALAGAALNGVAVVFSINILNGGAGFGETVCPNPPTGGTGYSSGRCKTGSAQLESWGLTLGPAGSGLLMWQWDSGYMGVAANDSAFAHIAADLASRPTKSWRRP